MIRRVNLSDAAAIADIYNYYVLHSIATFEEESVTAEEMEKRIESVTRTYPWFMSEEDGNVTGYAYANEWKTRAAYRHSVESTIYMKYGHESRGAGTELYRHLLEELENLPVHAVIGGIAQPNPACVALHEKLGFEKVAHFKETGYKFGRWIDVTYWERVIGEK